jgi:precorrin-3B synthase
VFAPTTASASEDVATAAVPTGPTPVRPAEDRCPGLLRSVEAEDGLLARIRVPGGLLAPEALRALATATDEVGDGRLELTSRGSLQVRGMTATGAAALAEIADAAGLLPTSARERVRNVIASPLAGIDSPTDLTAIVRTLDLGLWTAYRLGSLSGRFLFAIDDGRGDVGSSGADLVAVVRGRTAWVEGVRCGPEHVAGLLVEAATAFLLVRDEAGSSAWHVDDLPGGRAAIRRRLDAAGDAQPGLPPMPRAPLGRIRRADGAHALVVAPPLGRLTSSQARWLAEHAAGSEIRITPWRSVVLPFAPEADPAEVGLVSDTDSPWHLISACAGRPGCGQALSDVQSDAAASLGRWPGRRVHWSGCGRGCGRTKDVEVDVVAGPGGYTISA